MGHISLNLKARSIDGRPITGLSALNFRTIRKKDRRNFLGVKTARRLVSEFKKAGFVPRVERKSFSQVVISY